MSSSVKFIRVHGRIVPIRSDATQRGAIVRKGAAIDSKLAGQGRKVAKVAAAGAVAAGAVAAIRKSKRFGLAAGALGFGAFINQSFATGRAMAARDRLGYAKSIEAGKKIKRGTGFGGASDRAFKEASFIQRAPRPAIARIHGYFFGSKK